MRVFVPCLGVVLTLAIPSQPQPLAALQSASESAPETLQREGPATASALTLEAGSVARRQLVALGRDLVVDGEALADVAVLSGSAYVSGQVRGDVIVLGGEAFLEPTARVGGDIFVLGGTIQAATGSSIDGRSVAYPNAPSAWLVLLEGPGVGLSPTSPVVLGAKLALIAAWMATALLVLGTSRPQLLATAEGVLKQPFRNFAVGLTAVLAALLTLIFFSAFTAALVGVPLVALVVLIALLAKLWGMVAVFCSVGEVVMEKLGRPAPALTLTTVGLVLLGLLKLIPWVGTWIWTVATLIGVGAALTTKFGRREPWFDLEPGRPLALSRGRTG